MIREDNVTLQTLREDLLTDRISLKEYVTRSEGAALFTVAINKQLINTYRSHPSDYAKVFNVITKGDGEGSVVRFPSMFGINPQYVPEMAEIPFDQLDITSTTVEAIKFGLRMGISQEMIDDNEVSLINWTVGMVGMKMAELRDIEAFKCLDTFHYATGGGNVDATTTALVGNRNLGVTYTTGAFTNDLSASAADWEIIINTALNVLKSQTLTLREQTYRNPVFADTILVNSVRELALRKVLNSPVVIMGTGIGKTSNLGADQVGGGRNVFNGLLNIIASPYVARGSAYILQAKRGLAFLDREAIRTDRQANWAFGAEEVKAITRFMPAIIEQRSLFAIYLGTA
jgi:hypothetical protein